jgi:hypothetical protein
MRRVSHSVVQEDIQLGDGHSNAVYHYLWATTATAQG